jgi:hypothetical protein
MSLPILAAITVGYTLIAIQLGIGGDWKQAIVYSGYAFANVGLMLLLPR